MKKLLLLSLFTSTSGLSMAQVATEKHMPPLGASYFLRSVSSQITDAPAGANQVWDYNTLTVNAIIEYKVIDPQTLSASIKDAVPTAVIGYQQQGAPNADLAGYDFFNNSNTHLIKVGTKSSGSQPVQQKTDTLFQWGHAYGATVYYNGFYRQYCGYGTLKLYGKTYTDVAMIKSYNPALTADTLVQFHHFSPYYQILFSYSKSSTGLKNVLVWDVTSTGTSGIEENNEAVNFSVYPNPANEKVTVAVNNVVPVALNLYNTKGQLVKTEAIATGTSTHEISLSGLSVGVYTLQIGSNHRKLIVE